MKRSLQRDDGVAAIEFGLVLPLLVLILLGILDYGHAYLVKMTLTNAAREGARVGVTLPADQAGAAAETAATNYLASAGITTATIEVIGPTDDDPEVEVRVVLNPFEPLVGLVPTPSNLAAVSTMRWELAPIP